MVGWPLAKTSTMKKAAFTSLQCQTLCRVAWYGSNCFRAIDASTDSIVLDSFTIVATSLILNQMIDYNLGNNNVTKNVV